MDTSFQQHLSKSRRILVLCGAGISIPSGFPSLRTVCPDAMDIVTQEAWDTDPSAVWQYYTARRRQAAAASPNKAHKALAELAKRLPRDKMLTVSHNVDDLNVKAGHPEETLVTLLGNIFGVKCTNFRCNFAQEQRGDPLVPALDASEFGSEYYIAIDDLPHCPKCRWVLRPDCVWFGDPLSHKHLDQIDKFILSKEVDLVIIIGMSGTVWPTTGIVDEAVLRGAKVAVFNMDKSTKRDDAWFFEGDVTETLPRELEPWIGRL